MKKIGMIGQFSLNNKSKIGQATKTITIYNELKNQFVDKELMFVDTSDWKKNFVLVLFHIIIVLFRCKNVVLAISQQSLEKVYTFISLFNFFLKRRLHYIVIGGDLVELINKRTILIKKLGTINQIYVETETMAKGLKNLGLQNVVVLYNTKKVEPISEIISSSDKPYKLCTFSRVIEEKGILDAISVVGKINQEIGDKYCILDIFGPIGKEFEKVFRRAVYENSEFVTYKGVVPLEECVSVLKSYYLLLFPTKFKGEGFPGMLIDSYAAGVPIISSNWKYSTDLIDIGKTGFVFESGNMDEFKKILINALRNHKKIEQMRYLCIEKARQYLPSESISILIKQLA